MGPAVMARSLSRDLRNRVLAAIDDGASCRQAALRFNVSAASAIRWNALRRRRGDASPRPQGGDRRSHRIEAHAATILDLLESKRDITLVELKQALAERELAFGVTTLWRFFKRHRIRLKKRLHMPSSRIGQTS
jgi:transposase